MELFEMFYHILRFLKLRSSCSFCFQMLGFLIRAKHYECSDILQIFVPHYLEEPCRVMGRRRTRACPRVNRYEFDPPSQRAALEGSRFQLMPGDMENIPGNCSSYRGIF